VEGAWGAHGKIYVSKKCGSSAEIFRTQQLVLKPWGNSELPYFQADESKVVMREILEDPDEYVMFITRYSVSYLYRGLGSLNRIKNDHVA